MDAAYISPRKLRDLIPRNRPQDRNDGDVIEWGHHVVRYHIMHYVILCSIYERSPMSSHHKGREAIYSIINKICISNIETLHVPRYREELYNIKKYNKKNNLAMPYKKIPVLLFKANGQGSKYRIYCDFLVAIIKALQKRFLHHFASDKAGLPSRPVFLCI